MPTVILETDSTPSFWHIIDPCGAGQPQLVTDNVGDIYAPTDPETNSYLSNRRCSWLLQAPGDDVNAQYDILIMKIIKGFHKRI